MRRRAPRRRSAASPPPPTADFLATEAANIGAGAELLATRPTIATRPPTCSGACARCAASPSVKDHPSLADVLEATEHAAHPLERGEARSAPSALAVLERRRHRAPQHRDRDAHGHDARPSSPDLARFAAALDAMQETESGGERVVPISELFYQDGGPTVVETAANPPTSPAERFRLEVVSQGEHLRRLVADARGARDDLARDSVRRALRQALRGLRQAAESFGERDVAEFVASHNDDVVRLDARALDTLDEIAGMLAQPGTAPGTLGARLRALQAAPAAVPTSPAPAHAAPPRPAPTPPVPTPPAPVLQAPPRAAMTPVSAVAGGAALAVPQERDRPAAAAMADGRGHRRSAQAGAGIAARCGHREARRAPDDSRSPRPSPSRSSRPCRSTSCSIAAAPRSSAAARSAIRCASAGGPVDAETLGELFDLLDLALTTELIAP